MLFFRECKKVIFSVTFVIYCLTLFIVYFSQFQADCSRPLEKPVPGLESYGTVAVEKPELLMPAAAQGLVDEYLSGIFRAYPYGFYKEVRLTDRKKRKLGEIIEKITGISPADLDSFEDYESGGYVMDDNGVISYTEPNIPEIHIPDDLTYEEFRELMRQADSLIGGGSRYSDDFIVENFSLADKTYEDALAEYNHFLHDDRITAAYARLYCDYLGIDLSILPVFIAVYVSERDRRVHMEQLVYSRKISSLKLIFTRYAAMVSSMFIPVLITSILAFFEVKSHYPDNDLDSTAFIRYALFWLLPDIMTASSVGMLVTEISSGLTAVFVQGAWWFISTIGAAGGLTGNIGKLTLVMRHNSLLGYDVFNAQSDNIAVNRIFFTVLSIAAAALTAVIFEMKRRGVLSEAKLSVGSRRH